MADSSSAALSAPLISMASASDPFYLVRDTLEAETRALRVKFDAWKSALDSVNTSTDAGFRIKHEGEQRGCGHTRAEEPREASAARARAASAPLPCLNIYTCPILLSFPLLAEMKRDLTKVEEMCRKVKQAVLNVQNNRARFPHIDDRELNERKQFVEGLERVSYNGSGAGGRVFVVLVLGARFFASRAGTSITLFLLPLALLPSPLFLRRV